MGPAMMGDDDYGDMDDAALYGGGDDDLDMMAGIPGLAGMGGMGDMEDVGDDGGLGDFEGMQGGGGLGLPPGLLAMPFGAGGGPK